MRRIHARGPAWAWPRAWNPGAAFLPRAPCRTNVTNCTSKNGALVGMADVYDLQLGFRGGTAEPVPDRRPGCDDRSVSCEQMQTTLAGSARARLPQPGQSKCRTVWTCVNSLQFSMPPSALCRCALGHCPSRCHFLAAPVSRCLVAITSRCPCLTLPVSRCLSCLAAIFSLPLSRCLSCLADIFSLPLSRCLSCLAAFHVSLPLSLALTHCLLNVRDKTHDPPHAVLFENTIGKLYWDASPQLGATQSAAFTRFRSPLSLLRTIHRRIAFLYDPDAFKSWEPATQYTICSHTAVQLATRICKLRFNPTSSRHALCEYDFAYSGILCSSTTLTQTSNMELFNMLQSYPAVNWPQLSANKSHCATLRRTHGIARIWFTTTTNPTTTPAT